jgi:hypothetical protein
MCLLVDTIKGLALMNLICGVAHLNESPFKPSRSPK